MTIKLYVMMAFLLFLSFIFQLRTVSGAYQLEYIAHIRIDGSATWIIEHKFLLETEQDMMMYCQYSNLTYFSSTFIGTLNALIDRLRLKTGRENMAVKNFKITVDVFDSYRTVKYQFDWIGFGVKNGVEIQIGDVFEVEELFFLGEGSLSIIYPQGYVADEISPEPDVKRDQMLFWSTISRFETENLTITLKPYMNIVDIIRQNALVIIFSAAFLALASTFFWRFRKRKFKPPIKPVSPISYQIENDEDKVIALLMSAGGHMPQSAISEKLNFSRSKVSKLLALMENKGKIRREKRGREKLVILTEEFSLKTEGEGTAR